MRGILTPFDGVESSPKSEYDVPFRVTEGRLECTAIKV